MLFQNRRELVPHWQAEKAFVGGIAYRNFSYSSPLDGAPSLSVQRWLTGVRISSSSAGETLYSRAP